MSKGFQFKQFYIAHDQCGMKVGTDAILLGSWAKADKVQRILDVGTGSGILAIMLAQKSTANCEITAIDLDAAAIAQAKQNAANCPWYHQIKLQHIALQDFVSQYKYDLIISNPPYFTAQNIAATGLPSEPEDSQRQSARHTYQLSYTDLATTVASKLAQNGMFYLVLPFEQSQAFIQLAAQNALICTKQVLVMSKPNSPPKRSLMRFEKRAIAATDAQHLVIHDAQGGYSKDYRSLCKDYYLKF